MSSPRKVSKYNSKADRPKYGNPDKKKKQKKPKIFKCCFKECRMEFTKKGEFKTHAKTHRKKHFCNIVDCGLEFPSNKARKNHTRLKHPDSEEALQIIANIEAKTSKKFTGDNSFLEVMNRVIELEKNVKYMSLEIKKLSSISHLQKMDVYPTPAPALVTEPAISPAISPALVTALTPIPAPVFTFTSHPTVSEADRMPDLEILPPEILNRERTIYECYTSPNDV